MKRLNNCIDNFLNKSGRRRIWVAVILVALIMIAISVVDNANYRANIPEFVSNEQFKSDLEAGNIDAIYYAPGGTQIRYTLLNERTRELKNSDYPKDFQKRMGYNYEKNEWRMTMHPGGDMRKDVLEADSRINLVIADFTPFSTVMINFVITLAVVILLVVIILRVLMNMQGGRKYERAYNVTTKFKDVIGQDEVLQDLQFIVDLLKGKQLDAMGARTPKGVLLQGPPGTGKTLIARAVAGEAGVAFFNANASEFIEMYVGVGAKRVRELFRQARKAAPSIIFIDEIDAVAKSRTANRVSTAENDQTVNALLQEMDGFAKTTGVFLIAATNTADQLDDAIVRAGRFDRQIIVSPPRDWKVRLKLLEHYVNGTPCTADLTNISKQCVGFTGADIDMIVNEARLIAAMRDCEALTDDCFEHAIDKKVFKANRAVAKDRHEKDIKLVAYHEAGHAVLTYLSDVPIARASIIGSTGGVGGAVFQADKDNKQMTTKTEIEQQVRICYAGRVAEKLVLNDISDGACSDINKATSLLHFYVSKAGMDDEFGVIDISVMCPNMLESPALARVKALSAQFMKETQGMLEANMDKLHAVAKALTERETLSGDEVLEVIERRVDRSLPPL